jgi:hypothetical protein
MKILTLLGRFILQILFHSGDVAAGADEVLTSRSCLESLKLTPSRYADFTEKMPFLSKCHATPSSIPALMGIDKISSASSC